MGKQVFNTVTKMPSGFTRKAPWPVTGQNEILLDVEEPVEPRDWRLNDAEDGVRAATQQECDDYDNDIDDAEFDRDVDEKKTKAIMQAMYDELVSIAAGSYSAPTDYNAWRTKVRNKRKDLQGR